MGFVRLTLTQMATKIVAAGPFVLLTSITRSFAIRLLSDFKKALLLSISCPSWNMGFVR